SIAAVASRSAESSRRLAEATGGTCQVFRESQEAVDEADLVFLTVPDDSIEPVASGLRWRSGQSVVHCSGATEVSALAAAAQQGAQMGGFHPLQLFADPAVALAGIPGSSVAIEAPEGLMQTLRDLAASVGYQP